MEPATTNPKKKLHIPTWKKLPYNDCQIKNSHSSTLIKNKILTFGGVNNDSYLSNITLYDLQKEIIEHVKIVGQPARGREGHSACLYEENQIIIHGGCCQFDDWDVTYETGILTLKETDRKMIDWEKAPSVTYEVIETESDEEIRRYGHSAHIYENKMYVFGGCDPDWKGTNDLFCLHLDTWSWERLNPNGILPEKIYDQCSVLYNDQMFVYGGITPQTKKNLSTLYMLNLSTMFWRKVEGKGKVPGPLAGASAEIKDREIFIFGGADQKTEKNELYKYNIGENTWKEVITMEEPPLIRHWHSCVIVNNQMYIWGGKYGGDHLSDIYCLDLEPTKPKKTVYREGNSNAILEQLWKEKLMSDVILKVEGEEIPAHRSIISAGCKYFYGMFKSGMMESTADVIEIPGIKASSLKAMLEYIYCNKIEMNEDLALELLEPADKFLLSDLRDGCERFLVQCLNLENFVKIFEMTVDFETDILKEGIGEFITMNSNALKRRDDVKAFPEEILVKIHPDLCEIDRK